MWTNLKRNIRWYLNTDFDLHDSVSVDTVYRVVAVLTIIIVLGVARAHS